VFLTTYEYICTNNLSLLFDNTTGMTHLKIMNNNTKFKDQLDVLSVTANRNMCVYLYIYIYVFIYLYMCIYILIPTK